ncbi:ABC transporter ATP-binding protein [Paenibacillus tepidiphilus]|uniref:ABC transporter ATP-binding protein n=1 Tax=Paenibacillus tepidiphilus TaxID=2608683 RepID=UPI00123C3821|nr:ABC transporter ATP-binding protein [Paenibacillus tepidiphilus]
MRTIVCGENIVKSYGAAGEQRNVLNGVSAQIGEGEFVSVMGPSGSGKSTLLFALSGMDGIDGGTVSFDSMDLSGLGENALADLRRRRMGFVFQQPTLLKNLNVLDNIILPSMRDNRRAAAELTDRARVLMLKTGIAGLEERNITQLSGGQLQRAGICRALMGNPQVIFGDEPTGALNSATAQEIMDIFSGICADGTAVLLVTHDAKVAAQTERILYMRDGSIVSELRMAKFGGSGLEERIRKVNGRMQEIGI